jgi:alkanesulfonate monooxygenase SsuD/methylene tetrahydromethanopterin reductase-like flavin-dependent oxidoreductase (luciferase family)
VPLSRGEPAIVEELRAAPDWPSRPMTIVRITWMLVAESREAVLPEAEQAYEQVRATATLQAPASLDEFLAREVIGTPAECAARIGELEQSGIDYHLVTFANEDQQARVARLLLPLLR